MSPPSTICESVAFQFTASYEADRVPYTFIDFIETFQFTASYEADRRALLRNDYWCTFNSQPHTRLTSAFHFQCIFISIFQFTASYEADQDIWWNSLWNFSFNSQPHTRLTNIASNSFNFWRLSIHSLIRGWPYKRFNIGRYGYCLSIHSLIRGWPLPRKITSF